MSSSTTSTHGQIKQVLRTAMIGIQPGDQVMLKGYLRVLLRLEVDLEWVAANGPNIDLFIVNNQFRVAESVITLLQKNSKVPVLYVTRSANGDGELKDDLITLPLKKLYNLNYWLFDNVPVLRNNDAKHRQMIDDSELIVDAQAPTVNPKVTDSSTSTNATSKDANQVADAQRSKSLDDNEQSELVIEFLKKLALREDKYYELWADKGFIGIVQPKRQYIWLSSNAAKQKFAPDGSWELRDTQREPSETNKGEDLMQWLWIQAFNKPKAVLPLISPTQEFQLRFWMKPSNDDSRRELIRLFTALEARPRTLSEVVDIAETDEGMVKKALAGLLFSGSLLPTIDKLPKVEPTVSHSTSSTTSIKPQAQVASKDTASIDTILARRAAGEVASHVSSSYDISEKTKASAQAPAPIAEIPEPQPTQKRGFLSKLRDKLGL